MSDFVCQRLRPEQMTVMDRIAMLYPRVSGRKSDLLSPSPFDLGRRCWVSMRNQLVLMFDCIANY